MDLFNLFGRLTLDKSSYEYALKQSTNLTKQQASSIKATFDDMSKKNVQALKDVIQQLERGEVSLEEYRRKVDEIKKSQINLDVTTKEFGLNTNKSLGVALAKWGAVAVAVIAVTNAIYDQIKATIDYSNRVGDLAKNYGFTNKEIQEFDYWATVNGTTVDELVNSMKSLITNTVSGADKFAKLGVSLKDSAGNTKSQRDLFLDTVDALQKVESQTERNAYTLELFGDAGININQILGKSRAELEALTKQGEELGVFISDDAIENATNFNMELAVLGKQWQGLLASIFNDEDDVGEKVDKFIDTIAEKIDKALPKIMKIAVVIIEALARGILAGLPELISSVINAINDVDWFGLGLEIIKAIILGVWEGLKNSFLWTIGKGWLWDIPDTNANVSTTENQVSVITNSARLERTEKVEETLDISLKVESDGTTAGKENLDIVSDLVVDKINKILGGEV